MSTEMSVDNNVNEPPIETSMAVAELRTLLDMLRWSYSTLRAHDVFYGHGTDNAWDEAMALALHALHLPHDIDDALYTSRLTTQEREAIAELVKRRIEKRIPAPYLTRTAWFMRMPFYVDERVLVPRSPLAELIEKEFSPWMDEADPTRILDLCTGSGCIGIACALMWPEAQVDISDISDDALAVAAINVERHYVDDQVTIVKSDVFDGLKGQRYDIIVSNPPYVDAEDFADMPEEFRHEPSLGLESGDDGLDAVRRILAEAKDHLNPGGILVVEVGNSCWALEEALPELPFIWLDLENGGDGVFVLTYDDLQAVAD